VRFPPTLFLLGAFLLFSAPSGVFPGTGKEAGQRVVSMSPHYTSILFDIGAQDSLVGVTDYCRYPPEALRKPRVGGFLDPNIEKVVQLRPDLVLMLRSHGSKVGVIRGLGIEVLELGNDRIRDVERAYDELGRRLGRVREAAAAKARLKARLDAVRKDAGRRPLKVLFVVGKDAGRMSNICAAGPRTFPDELLRLAGMTNVVGDSAVRYPFVSKEVILRRDPDLIVQMPPEGRDPKALAARELDSWGGWKDLKAVREKRVFMVPAPGMMVPGPGMADLAEWLAKIAR